MGVVLKELKECRTALKVIYKKELIKPVNKLNGINKETEELIAIIAKSVATAKKNIASKISNSDNLSVNKEIENWILNIFFWTRKCSIVHIINKLAQK
jgi:hypothetical protein